MICVSLLDINKMPLYSSAENGKYLVSTPHAQNPAFGRITGALHYLFSFVDAFLIMQVKGLHQRYSVKFGKILKNSV